MSIAADYLGMGLKLEDLDGENVAYFKHCAEHSFHLQQCGGCKLLRRKRDKWHWRCVPCFPRAF